MRRPHEDHPASHPGSSDAAMDLGESEDWEDWTMSAETIEFLKAIENRLENMVPEDMTPADADRRDGALFLTRKLIAKAEGQ